MERTWLEGMNVVDNGGLCAGERKPVCKGAWCAGKSVGEDWQHTAAASTIFAALHDVKAWTTHGVFVRIVLLCLREHDGL